MQATLPSPRMVVPGHDVGPPERRVQSLHHDVLVPDEPVHQHPAPLGARGHHDVEGAQPPRDSGVPSDGAAVGHVDQVSPP